MFFVKKCFEEELNLGPKSELQTSNINNQMGFRVILSTSILFLAFCCSPDDTVHHYTTKFKDEQSSFDRIVEYIQKRYLENDENLSSVRLIFRDCEYIYYGDQICDEELLDEMRSLNIEDISVEKEFCNEDQSFDKIYFLVHTSYEIGAVYYIYDFCTTPVNIVEDKVYHRSITSHWYLKIDKT